MSHKNVEPLSARMINVPWDGPSFEYASVRIASNVVDGPRLAGIRPDVLDRCAGVSRSLTGRAVAARIYATATLSWVASHDLNALSGIGLQTA
jgi:hypothetical protein